MPAGALAITPVRRGPQRAGDRLQSAPQHPVPVFPLPGTVLFPHVGMPLHIFELRYRTMIRDALSRGRLLGLATLKPGWEADYYGSPEFHPLGCLARIEEVEWLPNDCYNLRIVGLTRVHFARIVSEYPYRAARVEVLPQHPYPEDDPFIQLEKNDLAVVFERLLAALGVDPLQAHVDRKAPFGALVNALCAGVELPIDTRLELLAIDSLVERGTRIRELTEQRLRSGVRPRRESKPAPEEGGERN